MINILIFFGIIILATLLVGKLKDLKVGKEINPSVYERKPYIFLIHQQS